MIKRIFVILLSVLMVLPLVACEKQGKETIYGFVDPNTDIEYVDVAPFGLYASVPSKKYIREYITVGSGNGKMIYYELLLEDPTEFLCIEDSGEYLLVRNKDIEEPTLYTFNPIAAEVYNETNTLKVTVFYADEQYLPEDEQNGVVGARDSALCQSIADAIRDGEDTVVEQVSTEDMFYIHLLSKDYPGLYYQVVFFGNGAGRYFLRDRATGKTVYCPRPIIERMVGAE